jgi:hypothetical protein
MTLADERWTAWQQERSVLVQEADARWADAQAELEAIRAGAHGELKQYGLLDIARHIIGAQFEPSFLELHGIL